MDVASQLNCYSMEGKSNTVAEEFAFCVDEANASFAQVCSSAQVDSIVAKMDAGCQSAMQTFLSSGEGLDDEMRCSCFLQLNPIDASGVACKSEGGQPLTLYEEYAKCVDDHDTSIDNPTTCTAEERQTALDVMDTHCQTQLSNAIEKNTPLSDAVRCKCFEQIDESIALQLNCKSMEDKEFTLAQEYQTCIREDTGRTCKHQFLYGDYGLGAMSADCQTQLQAGEEIDCSCFGAVTADHALSLKCQADAESEDNIATLYKQCVAELIPH